MELRELNTFVTIAQEGSFSRAAQKLDYSQAAVTLQIQQLERELNVQLFDRLGKHISLTNRGKIFYKHACKILNQTSEAIEAVATDTVLSGSLKIGTIDSLCSFLFPDILKAYHSTYPNVTLSVNTNTPAVLFEMLKSNDIDILYLLDENLTDSNWYKVIEKEEDVVFVTASSNPLTRHSNLTLDEIISYPFILTEKAASYRRLLDQYLYQKSKEIEPFLQTCNTDLIVNLLCSQVGISFLPKFIISDKINDGILSVLHLPDFNAKICRQVLYHRQKWVTREMKAFFTLLKNIEDNKIH